jgi:hypothetical protein
MVQEAHLGLDCGEEGHINIDPAIYSTRITERRMLVEFLV